MQALSKNSPVLTMSSSGGLTINLGITKTTNCVMTRALPIELAASHKYTPESPAVVLTMERVPSLEKLRLCGRLANTRVHVTVGDGNPVATHLGKVTLVPSVTYIAR